MVGSFIPTTLATFIARQRVKIATPLLPIILIVMGPRAARHLVTRTLARIPPLFIAILLMVPSFARKTTKPFNLLMRAPKSGLQKKWQIRIPPVRWG